LAVRIGLSGLGKDIGLKLLDDTEDGLRVRIKESTAAGREVTIDFALPGKRKPLWAVAEVRWRRAAGDGTFEAGVELGRRLPYNR
jgi:hypothetical protein